MKIAVIADIHGNLRALEAVVADLKRRSVDSVVNLGDHISGPLWPKETIDYLKQQDWVYIRGNHDRQLIEQTPAEQGLSDVYASQYLTDDDRDWLRALPARTEIHEGILLFHGSPTDDKQYLLETVENGQVHLATPAEIRARLGTAHAPVMLCGHTHIPRLVTLADQLLVNPGSVGLPAYDDIEPEPHNMEAGSPHARYAVMDNHMGEWAVELIAVAYDYEAAVKQALKNQRPDWATGLETGYM